MITVLVTGGFDPIHSGHISYMEGARALGDRLVVGINSDDWLERKKGRSFMPWRERAAIVESLGFVNGVIAFNDDDNTAMDAIRQMKERYPNDKIIFANGGDRNISNIPEMLTYDDVEFQFGVGGNDKSNSSSWILREWAQPTIERAWGSYRVLDRSERWVVKELSFDVGKALSDQRHFSRSEHWHIVSGTIRIELEFEDGDKAARTYRAGDSIDIPYRTWHRATNVGNVPAKVIEVWMGNNLTEKDIERRD